MIEKEIELTKETRNIFRWYVKLQEIKRELIDDSLIENLNFLFYQTPITKSKEFKAANISWQNTKFKTKITLINKLIVSAIIGLLIGTFYVFVVNSLRLRK